MANRPRHVLITGGSRGIGLAIAQLFSKNAYRCTLISRSESNLKAAVASLTPLPSPSSQDTPPHPEAETPEPTTYQHGYIAGDISLGSNFWHLHPSRPFIARLPKPERTAFPTHPSRIDVVVNCAGVTQAKLFSALHEEDLEGIVRINLTSMMLGTKFLLRNGYLRGRSQDEGEDPVIINVSSLLGLQGGYGAVAYAASKAGVLGFTRALATEYASHKVRVNAIVPGYVETDMTKDLNNAELEQRIPLNRFGKPSEIAHAALFLAENRYAHNCVLNLDGGLSAV
ncbi:3-oxoacyl-reductase [Alternaria rosae]|uniref:3-oxoacyl-reductase n=1 Tax=Alternaria rosae TaxID=1187941 RepID=UPI001E8E7291|nr:3-oxoacyl-reductase [Alternaria rosae]KAH6860965.1 3-oxoacyl-reductase [Alternaria rosae]